jgi:hypothetical protein
MSSSTQMLMPVAKNIDNLLQPSWIGKIDWARGLPTSPEKYKAAKAKIIDPCDEYKSPVWDDIYEYRKLLSNSNYNLFNNYKNISNLQDTENQFITISKNKKANKKAHSKANTKANRKAHAKAHPKA